MSIARAIWIGLLIVNGPVLILLCAPLVAFGYAVDHGLVPRSLNWIGLFAFLGGFVAAWLWWSLSVPKWRLWAYERVSDISKLKEWAVAVGLTWPEGHIFSRTEIKSVDHARREQQLDSTDAQRRLYDR